MTEPISGDPFRPAPLPGAAPAGSPPGTPVAPPPAPVRARGGGAFLNVLLGVALVVAVGGVAFAAGRVTAPAAATTTRGGFGGNGGGFAGGPNASGAPGGFGGGAFGGAGITVQGTVTAVSADSITLQLTGGQTVTIPTDASTTYHQRETATAAAVTTGSSVIVQLAGNGRGVFGNGGQGGGPTASGAPGRSTPTAVSVTVAPSGS